MEGALGQQYALQVAVETMKERCLLLQQRLTIVEEENMNLKVKYNVDDAVLCNKTDVESLSQKIIQLNKQKSQLTHNISMVATENKRLWARLSKLTQANQQLGEHLTKINDTLSQKNTSSSPPVPNQSNLIRSKTFTQDSHPKLMRKDDDKYSDTSLEDISLKIINSIAQEKYELEKQCAQMTELQSSESILTNSIGFAYPSDFLDDCAFAEMSQNMEKLIYIKDSLLEQRDKLQKGVDLLQTVLQSNKLCEMCQNQQTKEDKSENLNISKEENMEKMCPICNKIFLKENICDLVRHVETHFVGDED